MFNISLKGVAFGTISFFALLAASSVFSSYLNVSLVSGPFFWIYQATWILPGYVAAKASGKSGAVNGATVGIIVGVLVGAVSQIFFNNPPPNVVAANGIEVGALMGLPAIILCSLGGLIWEIEHAIK